MKVIVTGGGTGGHIYPAITIAQALVELDANTEIVFVGTHAGLESEIVPRYGYRMRYITVAGFQRSLGLSTVKSGVKLFKGIADAYTVLQEEKPDLVIGTGGYVCGPTLLLAALKGIPTCIQEQNAMPGVTNKILAKFVQKIFLGYEAGRKYFQGKAGKFYSGNPVRADITQASREEGIEALGLDPRKKTILSFGGSRGARTINQAMRKVEEQMATREDVQIVHVTGSAGYDEYMATLPQAVRDAEHIKILSYVHDMPMALAAADIAVSRAGAIGLAELMVRGVPSILIPYPYATANHQEYNARALVDEGAAEMILDKDLTGEQLYEALEQLLINEKNLAKMTKAAKLMGKPEAAMYIAKEARKLVHN